MSDIVRIEQPDGSALIAYKQTTGGYVPEIVTKIGVYKNVKVLGSDSIAASECLWEATLTWEQSEALRDFL